MTDGEGFEDTRLGRFERSGRDYTTTRAPRRAKPYRVRWEPRDPEDPRASSDVLLESVVWFAAEARRVHTHPCERLWPRWQSWRDSGDARDRRTTLLSFSRRIQLWSLSVAFDGDDLAVYASYDDDHLFGRHAIIVGLLGRVPGEPELGG